MLIEDALQDRARVDRLARKHARQVQKSRKRLERALARGNQYAAERERARLLNGFASKFCALYQANKSCLRHRRLEWRELEAEAAKLSLWHGTREVVREIAKPKGNGTVRFVNDFGPRNRALHLLLRWVLEPAIRPVLHESQFLLRGGRLAASQRVQASIPRAGGWAYQLDITDFYPSVDVAKVFERLGLPEGLGLAVMDAARLNVVRTHTGYGRNELRAGLPQGASLSPLLGEFVIAEVLREARCGPVAVFADNILCCEGTREEVEAAAQSLRDAFERHPLGIFKLHAIREERCRRVSDGFSYLGYLHRRRAGWVTARPSDVNLRKFVDRLWLQRSAGGLKAGSRGWCAAFDLCPGVGRFIDHVVTATRRGERVTRANLRDLTAVLDEPGFIGPRWG